jgi:hypothetical protein
MCLLDLPDYADTLYHIVIPGPGCPGLTAVHMIYQTLVVQLLNTTITTITKPFSPKQVGVD